MRDLFDEAPPIDDLIARGALFVLNHSAGKDSQAMTAVVRKLVPDEQLLVVYADLGRVEWPGNVEHIRATTEGLPLVVCRNERKDFFSMVNHRGAFPSPALRQCTSDLKRGPIEREIRRYLKSHPQFGGIAVNCMGLRAEESPSRAKRKAWRRNDGNSIAGREWYDWLPIHEYTVDDVFRTIRESGQEPHWAYAAGMSRLSCCFCIMASTQDLRTAARLRPELFREYVETERRLGKSMLMPDRNGPRWLDDVVGIPIESEDSVVRNAA